MIKVSIIIVTYNGMKWLEQCLASIPKKYKIIIVDNHSTDETVQFIEQNYPQAKLFKENQNLGFGQANNKGISYGLQQETDYVYLLNQDAYLENDTIEQLIKVHQSQPAYGILSPIHTNAEKTRLDKNFSNYVSYRGNAQFYSDFVLQQEKQAVYEVPFVNAAGWLLPKSTLLNVGGFDPIFFHYGEDDNYCQRVRYHNLKIGVVPTAFMVHDREDRTPKKTPLESEAFYKKREKNLKVKYADISNPHLPNFYKLIQKARKNYRKQCFVLKWENAKQHKQLLQLYLKIQQDIESSVSNNKQKGAWYLQIDQE